MRADRLVAILLMLQQRGQVTSSDVADELEVSERTARRDLEALGMAGLPVYSVQGRGGGWRLAGGGKTDLSGLSAAETRALFLVAGPSSATPEVRTALRKLVRALPEPFRADAEAASGAILVDRAVWGRKSSERTPALLDDVQQAVIAGLQVELGYVARDGSSSERVVHPLGLASKGPAWYLVADTAAGMRTFRVDRMTNLRPTGERVVRPPGFKLDEAWKLVVDTVEERRTPVMFHALAHASMVGLIRGILGVRIRIGAMNDDGRVSVEVRGHSARALAGELAGFGATLEVLDNPEVRAHLRDIGTELVALYP